MFQVVRGLVVRSVDYKEADKILTVLTAELGKITVSARGVRRRGSRSMAAAQLFAYSEMTLFAYNGRFRLNEAQVMESFSGLGRSVEALSLASYVAEVLGEEDEQGSEAVLRLALNTLYALAQERYPRPRIKAAFELRYMALSGYAPDLTAVCSVCSAAPPDHSVLSLTGGMLHCAHCVPAGGGRSLPLDGPALEAARYILTADLKRLFSFSLEEGSQRLLDAVCEGYLLSRLERGFRTLEFYRTLGDT